MVKVNMEDKNVWIALAFTTLVVGFLVGRFSLRNDYTNGQVDACNQIVMTIGAAPGTYCVSENNEVLVANELMGRKWRLDGSEVR